MSDVVTRFHPLSEGGFVVSKYQDAEPVLEANKALQGVPQRSDWGRHVASIPVVIWAQWYQETGGALEKMSKPDLARFIRKKLADPDWRWLRTS